MEIWYEIEDVVEMAVDEEDGLVYAECPFEVWEWYSEGSTSEAGLLARFSSRSLAESYVEGLIEQLKITGRGALYPKDDRRRAVEHFYSGTLKDGTVH